jgi:NTE family protein
MDSSPIRPRLALALSGGAARCIAHVGVIAALEEAGIEIDAVAGTSGGSLVGALYLDGMDSAELALLAARTSWASVFTPGLSKKGLINSAGIYRFIRRHLETKDIEGLDRPFAAVCADMLTGEKVVLTEGPLARAVQASCSLPIIFTPTEFMGRALIDGGYVSQIPVLAAREELRARVVVAVDVNYKPANSPKLTNMVSIAMHLTQLIARKNAVAELPHADTVISVDSHGIGLSDIGMHEELLRRGRLAAEEKVDEIKEKVKSQTPLSFTKESGQRNVT